MVFSPIFIRDSWSLKATIAAAAASDFLPPSPTNIGEKGGLLPQAEIFWSDFFGRYAPATSAVTSQPPKGNFQAG